MNSLFKQSYQKNTCWEDKRYNSLDAKEIEGLILWVGLNMLLKVSTSSKDDKNV